VNRRPIFLAVFGAAATLWSVAAAETVSTRSTQTSTPLRARYAWAAKAPDTMVSTTKVDAATVDRRVRQAFDGVLSGKGFQLVADPASADTVVRYDIQLHNQKTTDIFSTNTFCSFNGCIGGRGPIETTQGELTVEFLDKASGNLAWRAVSTKTIKKGDANQKTLNKVAREMTADMPSAR
jgi:hypothetical protein